MANQQVLNFGNERVGLARWRTGESLGYFSPVAGSAPLTSEGLSHTIKQASAQGFTEIVTAALTEPETAIYLKAGFALKEKLHLLHHSLELPDYAPHPDIRRGRRSDRKAIVHVDSLTFDDFWFFDENGLSAALGAASTSRLRVAQQNSDVVGYAITGKSGPRGYLQRLAVHPENQGKGLARALLLDSLHWLKRRHCIQASVNTQIHNARALELYEKIGFVRQHQGLFILKWQG